MPLCRHDIDYSMCADCLPGAGPPPREQHPSLFGPWFTARFSGRCAGCGESTEPGDDLRSDGQHGWLGRCCGEDGVPARMLPPVPDPKDILYRRTQAGIIDRGRGT